MADITERIGKLLRQAEGASTPEEAEAFTDQANLLAAKYDIDVEHALRKVTNKEGTPKPTSRTITIGGKGDRNLVSFAALMVHIARVYGCRSIIAGNNYTVTLTGMDHTIDLVELMYNSLAVQMQEQGNAFIHSGRYREVDPTVNHQVARGEFYRGFIEGQYQHLLQTYGEAQREAQRSDSGTALVLADRTREINALYREVSREHGVTRYFNPSHTSGSSPSSARRGREQGRNARAGGNKSIGGHRAQITK